MKPLTFLFLILISISYIFYYILDYELNFTFTNITKPLGIFYTAIVLFIPSVILFFYSFGKADKRKSKPKSQVKKSSNKSMDDVIKLINHKVD